MYNEYIANNYLESFINIITLPFTINRETILYIIYYLMYILVYISAFIYTKIYNIIKNISNKIPENLLIIFCIYSVFMFCYSSYINYKYTAKYHQLEKQIKNINKQVTNLNKLEGMHSNWEGLWTQEIRISHIENSQKIKSINSKLKKIEKTIKEIV